ncbi:flagellar hook-basal body protein FliE [Thioclava dalianensis]|uniref:Flagellar hook-basal body protein FliE n=1 Tax=Thioclava dalianensis TaxID=1185766 RepID=A0A074U4Y4_9RHOB|nr:flagellar hook-basal body complex protein FliE [Thioclava dalianensis]KEP69697.1 flagellar hook-basal body protein FliE [Thioclava dalianensis]SFM92996.1 flagellar hook-basal body complex protein FliE [Thioclava dalianensis]
MDFNTSLASQSYANARAAAAPQSQAAGQAGSAFWQVAGSFAETLQHGEETAKAAMTGGADPHALVQALAQTELAVETAVTVRNKVVEAYQEILRMPV